MSFFISGLGLAFAWYGQRRAASLPYAFGQERWHGTDKVGRLHYLEVCIWAGTLADISFLDVAV